jgi:carbon-monoxide dehydrogenase large subunit
MAGYEEIRAKQEEWRKEGTYIGIGISSNVEGTGVGPFEGAKVSIDAIGQVMVHTGAASQGQAHETVFGQVAGDVLAVGLDRVTVKGGDTSLLAYGAGTYASRSAVNAGSAAHIAAEKLRGKVLAVAGNVLGVAPDALTMQDGVVYAIHDPEKRLTFAEVAAASAPGMRCKVPDGMEPGLEAVHYFVPPTVTYSFNVNVAVVEVDIETGFVTIRDFYIVHDCGRVINPMVVEGQVQGGFAQGVGSALYEEVVYNENGQLLTGTYMDYLMPTSMEVPVAVQGEQEYHSPRNPIGVKGVGESGAISPPAAIANAVVDALSPFNIKIDRLPVSPNRVFDLLRESRT